MIHNLYHKPVHHFQKSPPTLFIIIITRRKNKQLCVLRALFSVQNSTAVWRSLCCMVGVCGLLTL